MSWTDRLPVVGARAKGWIGKGPSRLEVSTEDSKAERKAEERWKKAVRKRDDHKCRWCKREVSVCLDRIPERAECHHLTPREHQPTRWDVRNGVCLCCACHEKVTGRVNERFVIVATKLFTLDGRDYPNGAGPLRFKRVA